MAAVANDLKRQCADGKVLSFPTTANLVGALVEEGRLRGPDALDDPGRLDPVQADALAGLVRMWVAAGQTGCYYANKVALPSPSNNAVWSTLVVAERLDADILGLVAGDAMRQIGDAEIMMLVFPYVSDEAGLADLLSQLVALPDWWWEDRSPAESQTVKVGLRWNLPDREHVSWVLGFGPMPWLPFTRRSPATALVLRAQKDAHTVPAEEPEGGLRGVHLAHMDHGMGDAGAAYGPVWRRTEARKRTLLWDDLSDDGKLVAARLLCDDENDDEGLQVMGAAWKVLAPAAKARVTYTMQRALAERLPPAGRHE